MQTLSAGERLAIGDTPEEVIRRDIKRIGQASEIIEGRFAGSGFEMRDSGCLKPRALCQPLLAELPHLAGLHKSAPKVLGGGG